MFYGLSFKVAATTAVALLLVACQTSVPQARTQVGSAAAGIPVNPPAAGRLSDQTHGRTGIDVPLAWGGELRCSSAGCKLVTVEHEKSTVVAYELRGREALFLDRKSVAYHPDAAIWIEDDLVVAAVEGSFSLDVFRLARGRLDLIEQIWIGISPRDVVLISADAGRYRLLATPYSGKEVVWVDYSPNQPETTKVQQAFWCEAPWHPVKVKRAPGEPAGGVVAACLDDQQVVFVPKEELAGSARTLLKVPGPSRIVPRYTRPSPSGKWLYVALETGGRNLRFNMDSGELQWIVAPQPVGSVAVLPLSDDLVIWAVDSRLYLQRLSAEGTVLETRSIPTDGFSTGLQLIDADRDGVEDLVVHNSAALPKKMGVEIIYGPLWDRAQPYTDR
jgi:hypothetical protein